MHATSNPNLVVTSWGGAVHTLLHNVNHAPVCAHGQFRSSVAGATNKQTHCAVALNLQLSHGANRSVRDAQVWETVRKGTREERDKGGKGQGGKGTREEEREEGGKGQGGKGGKEETEKGGKGEGGERGRKGAEPKGATGWSNRVFNARQQTQHNALVHTRKAKQHNPFPLSKSTVQPKTPKARIPRHCPKCAPLAAAALC